MQSSCLPRVPPAVAEGSWCCLLTPHSFCTSTWDSCRETICISLVATDVGCLHTFSPPGVLKLCLWVSLRVTDGACCRLTVHSHHLSRNTCSDTLCRYGLGCLTELWDFLVCKISPLSERQFANIFSQCVSCIFTLLMLSFEAQKFWILGSPVYLFSVFCSYFWCHILESFGESK